MNVNLAINFEPFYGKRAFIAYISRYLVPNIGIFQRLTQEIYINRAGDRWNTHSPIKYDARRERAFDIGPIDIEDQAFVKRVTACFKPPIRQCRDTQAAVSATVLDEVNFVLAWNDKPLEAVTSRAIIVVGVRPHI